MGVYLYPNNTETPLKNAYIGEYQEGWQPGANTIAYYPLSSDLVDASGNSSDIIPSDSSSVIGNYQGVDCFNLNGYYCTVSNIDTLTTSNEYTFNFWLYRTARFDIMYAENGSWGAGGLMMYSGESQARWGNDTNQSTPFFEPPYNTWLNIVFTVLNGEGSIYVNNNKTVLKSSGVLAPNHNGTPLIIGGDYVYNNQGNGYLSKLIIEDKGWTAQEIADYYNQTKALYGGWQPGANTIAYYQLSSTTTVNDLSGNNRTLTNQGSVTFSDIDGAILDSNQKRLPFPSSFNMGTVITVSVWVRHTTTNALRILSDWSGVAPRIIFGIEQGALFCHMGDGSSVEIWKNIASSSTNTWEHYVLVKNGATCTYYKNGTLLSSHTYVYNPSIGGAENGNEYCIGMNEGGSNNIKDYIIESKTRTAQEVANYYNQTKSLYGIS